jgi:hypothetical protein
VTGPDADLFYFISFSFSIAGSRVLATKITKLEHTVKRGAFNVHVLGGSIVVNGVAASHFSTESKWSVNSAATKWYQVWICALAATNNRRRAVLLA